MAGPVYRPLWMIVSSTAEGTPRTGCGRATSTVRHSLWSTRRGAVERFPYLEHRLLKGRVVERFLGGEYEKALTIVGAQAVGGK